MVVVSVSGRLLCSDSPPPHGLGGVIVGGVVIWPGGLGGWVGGMVRGNNEKLPGVVLDHCIAVRRKMARSQWPLPLLFERKKHEQQCWRDD